MRQITGPTNPHVARDDAPGTIRALGTVVPIKDAEGNVVGDRMDNLVHASANEADAEREVKLWFRPDEIMPYMRAYPTEVASKCYFYKEAGCSPRRRPERRLAPGDLVWASDLDALENLLQGKPGPVTLETVAAKYLLNREGEPA